jgi:hypothetical protein
MEFEKKREFSATKINKNGMKDYENERTRCNKYKKYF